MPNNYARLPHWKIAAPLMVLVIAGCGSIPKPTYTKITSPSQTTAYSDATLLPRAGSGRGGYYQDDGPGEWVPANLKATPDAIPKIEPYRRSNSRPYRIKGKTYTPITDNRPFTQRGIASWYGKKFHGQKTASGERYDMYKMTAAHPTLPIPSYVRVTNLHNGKQVIVRVNDRGPFYAGRIIDLSYTAALKLGYLRKGHESVQVERLRPRDIRQMRQAKKHAEPRRTLTYATAPQQTHQPNPLKKKNKTPVTNSLAGYHLQLGVFTQKYYAEAMRANYASTWSGKLPPAQVVKQDAVYRLYAGPFANRKHAANAARQIHLSGLTKPLIVQH